MLLRCLSVHCNCITIFNLLLVSWFQYVCQILVYQLVPVYQSDLDIPVGTSVPVMVHSVVGFVKNIEIQELLLRALLVLTGMYHARP